MLRAGMKRQAGRRASIMTACALAACTVFWSAPAHAQSPSELSRVMEMIAQQEARLDAQERQLSAQQRQLAEQRSLIERQRTELLAMGAVNDNELGEIRGAGMPSSALNFDGLDPDQPVQVNRRRPIVTLAQSDSGGGGSAPTPVAQPQGPVGEAPPEQPPATTVEALPEGQNALLGAGRLVIEPSFEYSRSSSNRFVFRGVEIVTGVQIGLIEANDTARDTLTGALAVRYALTDRLEIEGRVPYIYRSDRITTVAQQSTTTMQTFELDGSNMGDIEMSLRYQLNNGAGGMPIFVAGARVKSDSGLGPFDLDRDISGVSTELATGSGFWGVQGSVSMLYPSDPVVIFANASYLYNIGRDVDETYGAVTVGEVDPGDSIGLGFGFGFALNPRFSYSLGYSHSYVLPTTTELNGVHQESSELQVGSLSFGMSFRATERLTLSTSVDVGVTEDAPDVRVAFRTPFRW
ncbi:MAG: hypothetical protein DCF16_04040 [Alphaproteobacteria bacterium]|nr:MAG: hypothetical protein DCF16_04040 [Alphaproteobacteria bacterium]